MSVAVPSEPASSSKLEAAVPTERTPGLRRDSRIERRVPNAGEKVEALPDEKDERSFEPHDTIPAPPWLEDLGEDTSPPKSR